MENWVRSRSHKGGMAKATQGSLYRLVREGVSEEKIVKS
jgi:hypothetical protein